MKKRRQKIKVTKVANIIFPFFFVIINVLLTLTFEGIFCSILKYLFFLCSSFRSSRRSGVFGCFVNKTKIKYLWEMSWKMWPKVWNRLNKVVSVFITIAITSSVNILRLGQFQSPFLFKLVSDTSVFELQRNVYFSNLPTLKPNHSAFGSNFPKTKIFVAELFCKDIT